MGLFGRSKNEEEEESFTSYYKCNGAIKVHVSGDGTEIMDIPKSFKWVGTEDEDEVTCPCCGEEIYYHKGEYICINCESVYTKEELEEHCGCGIEHG